MENKGLLKVNTRFDDNVVILKMFPGISQRVFNSVLNTPGLKGIVLETFGSGNVPTVRWLINCIKQAIKKGDHHFEYYSVRRWSGKYGSI